jgi:manganese transport protein
MRLVYTTVGEWLDAAGAWRTPLLLILLPLLAGLFLLLLWVSLEPILPRVLQRRGRRAPVALPEPFVAEAPSRQWKSILVPLDHTGRDRAAVAHAIQLARTSEARIVLLHVEEDVTSQVYGAESQTEEVRAGGRYIDRIAEALRASGLTVDVLITHSDKPAAAIVRTARELSPDLIVMAAHGHSGLKDLIFGATINDVRHRLSTPILVVRDEGSGT